MYTNRSTDYEFIINSHREEKYSKENSGNFKITRVGITSLTATLFEHMVIISPFDTALRKIAKRGLYFRVIKKHNICYDQKTITFTGINRVDETREYLPINETNIIFKIINKKITTIKTNE